MENKELYQKTVEEYLEDNHVYDIFEELLKSLIADLPPDPVEYLLEKVSAPSPKTLYFIGNSGQSRRDFIKSNFHSDKNVVISMHDLISSHVHSKGPHSAEISASLSSGRYIPDEIVLDLLETSLSAVNRTGKNLILEGVPRTRIQCLALHAGGLIPARILILMKNSPNKPEDNYHIQGVKEVYPSLCFETAEEGHLEALLKVKVRSNGPRRPPHVIILGPPGAGRSTQAQALADKYGLSLVSPGSLLRDRVQRKTELAATISGYFTRGDYVPDSILVPLIISRLQEPDCLLKGWVMDGFPKSIHNLQALRGNKISITHVFFLECTDSLVYDRTEERRLDPLTGVFYNVSNPPENAVIKKRLIMMPEDTHANVKKRLQAYKENLNGLKEELAAVCVSIDAREPKNLITERMAEEIENNKNLEFR